MIGLGLQSTGRESWALEAHHPDGHVRKLTKSFPVCRDVDEAMERLREKARLDPDFCAEYEGWLIVPVRLDKGVRLRRLVAQ